MNHDATPDLAGRTIVVTGAASGMGAATAHLAAALGANVIVADIDEDRGQQKVNAIKAGGGEAIFVRCDVSIEDDVEATVCSAVTRYGALDCAVNNAAVLADHRPLVDARVDEFEHIMAVDLRGVFLGLKHQLRQMQRQGWGSIVNVSSVNGVRARPFAAAYNAAKHGVIGLTRTAALEVAGGGIRVNVVCPGAIDTPMMQSAIRRRGVDAAEHARQLSPMGRFGEPDEVAAAIVWLCSDAAAFVTGTVLTVDGGYLGS